MLTTVDRVQRQPGMSSANGTLLEDLILEAGAELVGACSREFKRAAGQVERVAGYGIGSLVLKGRLPLVSIETLEWKDTAGGLTEIDATGYEIENAKAGLVRRLGGVWAWTAEESTDITRDPIPGDERAAYVVTYTGGWVTRGQSETAVSEGGIDAFRDLPYDIERAIIDYVVTAFRSGGRDKTVTSKRLQSAATGYRSGGASSSAPAHWPPSFATVVERYRR